LPPRRRPVPKTGRDWEPDQGIIDQLLHLRTFADPAAILTDDNVVVWQMAVDAALDIVVPEMRRLLMLPPSSGMVNQSQLVSIIGKVPLG